MSTGGDSVDPTDDQDRSVSDSDVRDDNKHIKRKRSEDYDEIHDPDQDIKKQKGEDGEKRSVPISGWRITTHTDDLMIIEIPQDKVGQVIGSKGMVIHDIQSRSGCQAKVNQDFPPGVPRQVELRGTAAQLKTAADLVKRIVEHGAISIHANTLAGGPNITTTMDVAVNIVGKIIGSGGQTIKEIQSISGAKVQMHQDFPADQPRKLEITGTATAVAAAVQLVQTIMMGGNISGSPHGAQSVGHGGRQGGQRAAPVLPPPAPTSYYQAPPPQHHHHQHHQPPIQHGHHGVPPHPPAAVPPYSPPGPHGGEPRQPGEISVILEVPKMIIGKIIGKGGDNIQNLQRKSGCNINVDQKVPEGYPCKVHVTGVPFNVDLARRLVDEIQMGIHTSKIGLTLPPPVGGAVASAPVSAPYSLPAYSVPTYQIPSQTPAYAAPYGAYPSAAPAVATYPYSAPTTYSYAPNQSHYGNHQHQHQHHNKSNGAKTSASAPAVASSVWTEYKDEEGRSYWYNSATGVSQWEAPNKK